MRDLFDGLVDPLGSLVQGGEVARVWFSGEQSDFVRLNRSLVRQATSVRQASATLSLVNGGRRIDTSFTLTGIASTDREALARAIARTRSTIADVPEDPHLAAPDAPHSTDTRIAAELPDTAGVIGQVLGAARGHDLVGLYAAGPIWRGFADSRGQRNWHESAWFDLSFSLFLDGDKAAKGSYAGGHWDDTAFSARFDQTAGLLGNLALPPITLEPGHYRAYIAPAALAEMLELLNWGSFSGKSRAVKQSPLIRLWDGAAALHAGVNLHESFEGSIAPLFQSDGFVKPARVTLVQGGRAATPLVSPRTAREYGIASNNADDGESAQSLSLEGGTLAHEDILGQLDRGLYIGNLWYLNYSDREACRITGMTRFATFWVEDGRIVAPVAVVRFDDTVYRMLGSELEALTRDAELVPDSNTYGERSTRSITTPGALLRDFAVTL